MANTPDTTDLGIFYTAQEFELTSKLLDQHFYRLRDPARVPPRTTRDARLKIATVVNSAFALELYLKCLLTIEGVTLRPTHALLELFKQLQPDTQKEIRRQVAVLRKGNPKITTTLDMLKISSHAFEDFRYIFEKRRWRKRKHKPWDRGCRWNFGYCAFPMVDIVKQQILKTNPGRYHVRSLHPSEVVTPTTPGNAHLD